MVLEAGQEMLHYRLIEKIGEGGMGVVWKAEDTKLERRIALKVLPAAMAADPDRRTRFEREARVVAGLNHPNIVTLHSVEEFESPSGTAHFITMELVEGQTLTELLPRNGFPLTKLLEIAIPLTDAVSRAHRAGITHRDLKPDNIMIDREGRLRVLDFGLAKLHEAASPSDDTQLATVTSDTAEGRVVGTVAYMSPEQAEGKAVDARSDIFSLGTILYQMASGTRPFRGDTTMSTIGAILKDEPSSIVELKPSLPRHTGRIIRRCLAKQPDRRYQTSLDLRNELEELKIEIESEPATAPISRRSRMPLLVGAVGLLVIVAILAMLLRGGAETSATRHIPRPITASTAWDSGPNWSPDGKFIAFERKTSGHLDVYVKPIDGGEAVLRAGGPGDQYAPRWTPDGGHLAYISKHKSGNSVYLMPSDGGNPRELIATNIPTLELSTVMMGGRPWSLDGQSILVPIAIEPSGFAVHRIDRTTGDAEQITFPPAGGIDSHATYSFDGAQILFRREVGGGAAMMLMPAEGGEPEGIVEGESGLNAISWRPDNRHVVFQSYRDPSIGNLYSLDLVTREVERLTYGAQDHQGLSVSLDDRILYTPFWHDQFLYVVDVDTGERVQVTSHSLDNLDSRFAPDGRSIVYSSNRTGNYEIWIHDLESGRETRFTDHDAGDTNPEWSPDGRRIVFASDRLGGNFRLFVANADGGTQARLLSEQTTDFGAGNSFFDSSISRWSPDGESIAYYVVGNGGAELWTIGADGRDPRKRLDGVTGFDWYRDSRQALITRTHGTEEELIAVDLESGEERSLFIGALQEFDAAPDGNAVAFCYGRGHLAMGLAVLQLEASSDPDGLPRAVGEPEQVVETEGTWHVHNGGWSPDSKKLVYTRDWDYGDIYELVPE